MRVVVFSVALLLCSALVVQAFQENNLEDDDFAEFEQFEADDEPINDFNEDGNEVPVQKAKDNDFEAHSETEDEIIVEDEDNEFEHFQDPEEFEGLPDSTPHTSEQPKITISKVPITVRPRWDAYWLEGVLCCLLMAYALGYALGRSKNTSIALNFLKMHKPLLDDNFTLVGETGLDVVAAPDERGWRREAEHVFTMWCSGRVCCEGMLLTLKLIKRQDLVHVLLGIVKPTPDTLQIRVELGKDDGDPFVLCVAQKKHATRLAKEMQDLSVFCPERRPGESHGLPVSMSVMSESAEAAAGVLDTRTCAALHQYATHVQYIHISDRYTGPKQMDMSVMSESAEAAAGVLDTRTCAALHQYATHVQYIHISDRYTGPKQMEETAQTKPPDTERVLLMNIALGADGGGAEVRPLLLLAFHLLERIKRLRLSKEALAKCEKRRQKVAEAWVRGAHAARQEQAAQRREEKRKQEKEKILAEDDPEKQRRWELKEQKREKKRKTPKMKQLKVKAM